MKKNNLILAGLAFCVLVILGSMLSERKPPKQYRALHVGSAALTKQSAPLSDNVCKNQAVELSFELLKKWTYVKGKPVIPDFIRVFDDKCVDITGYMMPLNEIDNIKSFILVPALFGCCYGQPPAVNHIVLVNMANGVTTKYIDNAIRVRGRFHCGEEKLDGELLSLYRIDAVEVVAK
jgi:hypothetical protein